MSDSKQACWPGWETVRLIGRGSFGEVYEIQRQVFNTTEKAALKMISLPQNRSDIDEMYSDGYDDASITSTFQSHLESIVAEYSMMRKMKGCANIVNCDDIRFEKQSNDIGWDIYIKMELLQPIVQTLPKEIPEETVIKLGQDMCAALELCKKHGIIHRDIKPQNIFLSEHGDYKLGDFGIAKTVEKTMGGTKIGTYKYMAPEVYNNQPYGAAVDIYSLGLVMYWLLNKRRMPFMPLPPEKLTAGMDDESRHRRFSGEPLPPPATGSDELKRIVLKACAFDPKERYSTAAEMLDDLNRLAGVVIIDEFIEFVEIENRKEEKEIKGEERKTEEENTNNDKGPRKSVIIGILAGIVALIVIILLLARGCADQKPGGTGQNATTDPISTTAGTDTTPPETTERYELVLNTDRLSVFEGDTATLEVSGIPENAAVEWSSSDKSVAKIDSDGEVIGVSEGVAVITVTWENNKETHTASVEVTVTAAGVTLDNYSINDFYVGQTRTLSATTSPAGGHIAWKSSNTSVATVDSNGIVTAVGAGSATITVAFGEYTESCDVTVMNPSVTLDKTGVSLYIGETAKITASVKPQGSTVTWKSSDTSVATVDSSGVVTAVSNGTVKITASCGNTSASCDVTVKKPGISLNKTSISLMVGDSDTVYATVDPKGATVSWSSSNTGVATVSGGTIKATGNGTTTITAQITYLGKIYKATCSVSVVAPQISVISSADTITYAEREQDRGTCTLTADVTPDGGTVEWTSSNSSVAQVSGNGTKATVKAISEGSATITATYTVRGKIVKDTCTITVQKAASTLGISGFGYPSKGTVNSFAVYGTITSNYSLTRIEASGYSFVNALNFKYSLNPEPYTFIPGTYEGDCSVLTAYFIDQFRGLYNAYSTIASVLHADPSVEVHVTVKIYDASGNTETRNFIYTIIGG